MVKIIFRPLLLSIWSTIRWIISLYSIFVVILLPLSSCRPGSAVGATFTREGSSLFSHAPAVLEARLGAVHSLIWSHAARFRCANILPREGMSSLHLCQLVRDPIEIAGHSKERTFHVFIRQPARSFIKHIADPRHDICSAPNLTRKIITVFFIHPSSSPFCVHVLPAFRKYSRA